MKGQAQNARATRSLRILVGMLALSSLATGCEDKQSAQGPLAEGDRLLFSNKPHEAVPFYNEAIEIDPECKKAYLCRAMAYLELEKPERALDDFTKAIELDPEDSYPYEQRAKIYRTVLKDEAKAKKDQQIAEAIRQRRWSDLQKLHKRP